MSYPAFNIALLGHFSTRKATKYAAKRAKILDKDGWEIGDTLGVQKKDNVAKSGMRGKEVGRCFG